MTQPSNSLSLVADVGGTNTRVALADGDVLREGTVGDYVMTGVWSDKGSFRQLQQVTGR